ncbi:MAG: ABC transporter substrate-binding protein [candidate division NC10 bacterium]
MDRRAFIWGVMALLGGPFAAQAQPAGRVPRVGFLCARAGPSSHTVAFLHGLRELGYVEGKDILIEWRFAPEGRRDPFPDLAAELVRLKVNLIVVASPPAIRPTKAATTSIPIIMAQSDDPIGAGFVTSLARPGGNITGLSFMAPELSGKQLELLKAAVPRASRVAVLSDINDRFTGRQLGAVQRAAATLGVKLQPLPIRGAPKDFDRAFAAMRKERAEALVVLPDVMFFDHQERLTTLAAKSRLPAVYGEREFADAGGLMAYGPNYDDLFRRSAYYVNRILKGAKPADLPVEQPTKFDLVINLKTAKALGLTIPQSLLVRADQVIQ